MEARTLLMLTASLISFNAMAQYPKPYKQDQKDNFFGTTVADPYRWMENENSDTLRKWIDEEFFSSIPYRDKVRKKLQEVFNYPRYGAPSKQGDLYIFSKNSGLQNQSVIYKQKGLNGTPEVLIDPNTFSADGTVALGGVSFTDNGKYMGYTVSASGSDWQEANVMEVATGRKLTDHLEYLKFTGLNWKGDEGFYYSRYPKPDESRKLTNQNENMKVYFHKLGDPQEMDQLVYEDPANPKRRYWASVTEDERFLILYNSEGTSGKGVMFRNLKDPSQQTLSVLFPGYQHEYEVVDNVGDKLLVLTNEGCILVHQSA
jgi:prolyl oligopeptidase